MLPQPLRRRPKTPRRFGFTLIELITVVAIIGILAALLITVIGKVRGQSALAVASSNLRQIQIANQGFATANQGRYTPMRMTSGHWWYQNHEFLDFLVGRELSRNHSFSADHPDNFLLWFPARER